MQSTARFAPVPRLVWLLVVLGLILAIGATALFVGSRTRKPLPAPFGPTAHGTVLYSAADGDIHVIGAGTDEPRPLITGPTADSDPTISPDGTTFVFSRQDSDLVPAVTMVANVDGSDIRVLRGGARGVSWIEWSPDSARLVVVGTVNDLQGMWILSPDAASFMLMAQQPGTPFANFNQPQWRPSGQELVFLANSMDNVIPVGLYAIQADGTRVRTIVEPTVPGPAQAALSPDGTLVAYSTFQGERSVLHVVNVDTGEDAVIAFAGNGSDQRPHWSPNGRQLVFERYDGDTYHLAVGSANGGPVVELGPAQPANTGGSRAEFSPDGTKVLAFYNADSSSWVLDPVDGTGTQLSPDITSPFSVQRIAP